MIWDESCDCAAIKSSVENLIIRWRKFMLQSSVGLFMEFRLLKTTTLVVEYVIAIKKKNIDWLKFLYQH